MPLSVAGKHLRRARWVSVILTMASSNAFIASWVRVYLYVKTADKKFEIKLRCPTIVIWNIFSLFYSYKAIV